MDDIIETLTNLKVESLADLDAEIEHLDHLKLLARESGFEDLAGLIGKDLIYARLWRAVIAATNHPLAQKERANVQPATQAGNSNSHTVHHGVADLLLGNANDG